MADAPVVHIGENSPEHVAFQLLNTIASIEGIKLYGGDSKSADRKWVLDTYAECLNAVRNPGGRTSSVTRTDRR